MTQKKNGSQGKVIRFPQSSKESIISFAEFKSIFAQEDWELRKNVMTGVIELNGQPITDNDLSAIRLRLREMDGGGKASDLSRKDRVQDAIVCAANENQYHPIMFYLRGCADVYAQNPEIDWIDRFCRCFKTNEPEVFKRFITKWLIGCAARVLDGFQNYVLVLKGPQGIGKSFVAAWLASGPQQAFGLTTNQYFHEGGIDPTNKDHVALLATKWIWSSDEIGGTLRKRDRNELKEFLTKQEVSLRLPYDKYHVTLKRNCSIIANTNEDSFLDDPTGNRRYLVLEIEDIDHVYSSENSADLNQSVSLHDLWGQVLYLYERGASPHLTGIDREWQNKQNLLYEKADPIEDYLSQNFIQEPSSFLSTLSILEELKNNNIISVINKAESMRLADAARKVGFVDSRPSVNGEKLRGYKIKKFIRNMNNSPIR